MEYDDIKELLSYEPFRTLRFHITDGTIIEIDHPDMAILGKTAITLSLRVTINPTLLCPCRRSYGSR